VELAASKREDLTQAVAAIRGRFGAASLATGTASAARLPEDEAGGVPTGIPELDGLTPAAGFPYGRLSLLVGAPGAGRMSLVYRLLAEATQATAVSLFLDLREHADPWLMQRLGARLDRLVVLRGELTPSLEAAVALVRAGAGCVAVDLPPGAGRSAAWDPQAQALAAACARERACCVIGTEAQGEPLAYASSLTLRLRRRAWTWRHGDVDGVRVAATVEKSKLSLPGAAVEFEVPYPRGVFMPPAGLVAKAGAAPEAAPGGLRLAV